MQVIQREPREGGAEGNMAYKCDICGKAPVSGNAVSHSNKKTKRAFRPNLKTMQIVVNGSKKRVKVCTRCLRSLKVQKAV